MNFIVLFTFGFVVFIGVFFFSGWCLSKIFCDQIGLMFFGCDIWEWWFIWVLISLFNIFLIKFQIILGLVLEFIFEVKVLQENLLASLMVCWVLALCCLYLRFSEGFVFKSLWVTWHSLIIPLHSSVNQVLLCFGNSFLSCSSDACGLLLLFGLVFLGL